MNTLKDVKRKRIMLISLFVAILGIIILLFRGKDIEASGVIPACPYCNSTSNMVCTSTSSTNHSYTCSNHHITITEGHGGGTHANGGNCTACGVKYQSHALEITEWKSLGGGTHQRILKCSYSGCTATATAESSGCEGATHENGGKCTKCNGVYQEHEKSNDILEYKTSETAHIPVYKCSHNECTQTFEGTSEGHSGASHDNGRILYNL